MAQLIRAKRLTKQGRIIGIQRKLTVGPANDQYEQEADHVAHQVMSMSDSVAANSMQWDTPQEEDKDKDKVLQTKPLADSVTSFVQPGLENRDKTEENKEEVPVQAKRTEGHIEQWRQPELEEEEKPLHAKSVQAKGESQADSFDTGADVESRLNQSKSGGSPLPDSVRAYMKPRFGTDFGHVRVHTGSEAIQMNRDVGAKAFPHDSDIYYGAGQNPGDFELTAHELTHVVQQTGGALQREGPLHIQHALTAEEKIENLKSPGFSGDPRLEDAFDNSPPMRIGEIKEAVAKVQQVMINDGFNMPISTRKTGAPDGIFGDETRETVKLFQIKYRLEPDGEVGRHTLHKMDELNDIAPPPPSPPDPHVVYERKLREAIALLNGVRFGRADSDEHFDTNFWNKAVDPDFGLKLVLKAGKRPSDAIDALFAHLDIWSVDCAEFIQVAEWYALRHAQGAEDFNDRVKGLSFDLRPHGSTGINQKEMYFRDKPSDTMLRASDHKPEPKAVDQLVADAPFGSRVTWTNLKAPISSAFHNENTIKIGDDLFAAHGFGGSRNTFSRSEIEVKLAQAEDPSADSTYIATNIYISQIEHYETP
jgi:peptidoglycan hydrolase-like protein with peptidoglycan-binding domain